MKLLKLQVLKSLISKNNKYNYFPNTKKELQDIIY